jgi:succinyl-CoA synthetase beta subunit
MNLHEYQAKSLLQKYNIPVPRGQVVSVAKDVPSAISE